MTDLDRGLTVSHRNSLCQMVSTGSEWIVQFSESAHRLSEGSYALDVGQETCKVMAECVPHAYACE